MKYRMLNWNSGVNAFTFLLLGLLLLIFPDKVLDIGGYVIASVLLLGGANYLIKLYRNRPNLTNGDIIYLLISIAAIAVSISIFIDPTWVIRMLNIVVGIILLISGLMNLNNLLKFKDSKTKSWWVYASFIGVILLLAILVLINPLWLATIITRLAGASLIIDTIITYLLSRKVTKKLMLEEKSSANSSKEQ